MILAATIAQAEALNLVPRPTDIASYSVFTQYTPAGLGGELTLLSGLPLTVDFPGGDSDFDNFILNGAISLNAKLTTAGDLVSGDLAITGEIYDKSLNPTGIGGTLLTATLVRFGFDDDPSNGTSETLEFMFDATGGLLDSWYGRGGAVLNFTGFNGDFVNGFQTSAITGGTAHVFAVVPLPSTAAMVLVILGGLAIRRV